MTLFILEALNPHQEASSFQLLLNLASIVILIITACIYWRINKDLKKSAIRDATQKVYKEWWSNKLHQLRKHFYLEFSDKREDVIGKGLKEIEDEQIRQLCYFFDRVGWLGAAGLIDVDYILGPMQHFLRRCWLSTEPFIVKEREHPNSTRTDPVYLAGFHWLFKRSEKKHQADLIRRKFKNPRLFNKKQIQEMKGSLNNYENIFMNSLVGDEDEFKNNKKDIQN